MGAISEIWLVIAVTMAAIRDCAAREPIPVRKASKCKSIFYESVVVGGK